MSNSIGICPDKEHEEKQGQTSGAKGDKEIRGIIDVIFGENSQGDSTNKSKMEDDKMGKQRQRRSWS